MAEATSSKSVCRFGDDMWEQGLSLLWKEITFVLVFAKRPLLAESSTARKVCEQCETPCAMLCDPHGLTKKASVGMMSAIANLL